MRIKIFGQPGEIPNAVKALNLGFEVAHVGRPLKTRNAGQPGEVSVNIRAAVRRSVVAS